MKLAYATDRSVLAWAAIGLSIWFGSHAGASERIASLAEAAAAEVARSEALSAHATTTYDAVAELFSRQHASADELATAQRDAAIARIARDAAVVWNTTLSGEAASVKGESVRLSVEERADLSAAIQAEQLNVLPLLRGYLARVVEAAVARADQQIASNRLARFASVPASARRIGEETALTNAVADAEQVTAGAERALRDARETLLAFMAKEAVNGGEFSGDWEPVALLADDALLFNPEGGLVVSRRRTSAGIESRPRFVPQSRIEPVAVSSPRATERTRPSQATTRFPGRTYSSGYAFGQVRRDFPADLRFPRADGFGGPWYLPGSPTNELRFRRRLSNDGR